MGIESLNCKDFSSFYVEIIKYHGSKDNGCHKFSCKNKKEELANDARRDFTFET